MEKKKIGEKEPYEIQRLPDRDDAAYDEERAVAPDICYICVPVATLYSDAR